MGFDGCFQCLGNNVAFDSTYEVFELVLYRLRFLLFQVLKYPYIGINWYNLMHHRT